MTDHAESASVTVRVVHGSEAVSISLAAQSSVRVLKERLQELHPQRPSPVEQKLIFGGRVLDDARVLSEVFANSLRVSDVVSVHLILNGSQHHATAAVPATSEAPRQPTTIPAPSAHLGAGSFGLTRRVVTVPCIYIKCGCCYHPLLLRVLNMSLAAASRTRSRRSPRFRGRRRRLCPPLPRC